MAEPLLKRTFSRLRGKERSRRKTDPKIHEVPVQPDSPFPRSRSDSSPNNITVAKKQSWGCQGSEAPPIPVATGHSPRPAAVSQDATGQSWSHRLAQEKAQAQTVDRTTSSSCAAVQQEATEPPPSTYPKTDPTPAPSASSKSGQRGYLQSLDRSSRAWVLSSGKAQASDEASGAPEESNSNIWYNPIPEEDDPRRDPGSTGLPTQPRRDTGSTAHKSRDTGLPTQPRRDQETGLHTHKSRETGSVIPSSNTGLPAPSSREQDVWRRRGEKDPDRAEQEPGRSEGGNPSVSRHVDDITTEHTDSSPCDALLLAPPPADCSPASRQKGGVSGSVMDRLRSPGTVRKLSMKMKKLPELRRKLSLRSHRQGNESANRNTAAAAAASSASTNENVTDRYHLDSSAPPARPARRSSRGRSASKGGYLSDGDSPELLPRQQAPPLSSPQEAACDITSFRLVIGSDTPRCSQRVTGLLTVHLIGLEEMKAARSEGTKEIFLAIQIDGVTRARTSLLTLRGAALTLNHAFHLQLERARLLRVVVLTPANQQTGGGAKEGPTRNRVCCLGGVSIPPLFKGSRSQQLCVKLEPRGLLYVKLSLQEKWDTQPSSDPSVPANVFGVELHHLVEREGSASPVPLLIQKTVAEIERRGLKTVGLYRLCGSAAVKKELRDWFERNSSAVCLSEDLYPDINVITGILKDYLRELPSQLITRNLYEVVREAMTLRPPPVLPDRTIQPTDRHTHIQTDRHTHIQIDRNTHIQTDRHTHIQTDRHTHIHTDRHTNIQGPDPQTDTHLAQRTVELLGCLPPPERATLSLLLDHLSLVASHSQTNRMTHQNLAVCFGPVLLTPTQEGWMGGKGQQESWMGGKGSRGKGEEIASAVDFKRHIEALHYLLQLWPVPTERLPSDDPLPPSFTQSPLRLCLAPPPEAVVSRRGRGARLDSPPLVNRYAGDWSVCGTELLCQEGDYDEVAGSDSDEGSDGQQKGAWSEFMDFDAPFNCRLSLKDFDNLILDLDRELGKHLNICL